MSMAGRQQQEWTPEREQQLRDLAAKNLSAEMICKEIGATSRCAVVGKAQRMGIQLNGYKYTSSRAREPKIEQPKSDGRLHSATVQKIARIAKEKAAPPSVPVLPATEGVDLPPEVIPADQRKTLYELTADTCRWPIGDPDKLDFHFCGGSAPGERPYCSAHSRIAYETPAQRKIRIAAWRTSERPRFVA